MGGRPGQLAINPAGTRVYVPSHGGPDVYVIETGANDVFVVAPAGGGSDLLLPYHPSVILDISPEAGRMVVRPMRFFDDAPLDEGGGARERSGVRRRDGGTDEGDGEDGSGAL